MASNDDEIARDALSIVAGTVALALLAFVGVYALFAGLIGIPLFIGWRIYRRRKSSPAALERQAREHLELLYRQALAERSMSRDEFVRAVFDHLPGGFPGYLNEPVREVIERIYDDDAFEVPRPPAVAHSSEGARYQLRLAERSDPKLAVRALAEALSEFSWNLPHAVGDGLTFEVPVRDRANNDQVSALIYPLFHDDSVRPLPALSRRLDRNFAATAPRPGAKPVSPHEYKGAENVADVYLRDTPLLALFEVAIPFAIPTEARFSHMHVVGGSGAGKTQLLQHLILSDLEQDDPPALVVVDSQGDLISKLLRLALFDPEHGPLRDRLLLITPRDIEHPPAINIFDIKRDRLARYGEEQKEQIVAGVVQTFDYLFSGLLGADLTAKQGVFFRFVARLMLALPETLGRNATILDMLRLMEDAKPYAAAIERLPPIPREFFERDFNAATFKQTKEQIRYRLNAILENPTLARLFTATHTKVDLFTELNRAPSSSSTPPRTSSRAPRGISGGFSYRSSSTRSSSGPPFPSITAGRPFSSSTKPPSTSTRTSTTSSPRPGSTGSAACSATSSSTRRASSCAPRLPPTPRSSSPAACRPEMPARSRRSSEPRPTSFSDSRSSISPHMCAE